MPRSEAREQVDIGLSGLGGPLSNTDATLMIEWIPTAIVFALGAASFAVVFMAAMVGIIGFIGFQELKRLAVKKVNAAAEKEMKSEGFKEMVRDEVKRRAEENFLLGLQDNLDFDTWEDDDDQGEA